jgi:hypothetical protein
LFEKVKSWECLYVNRAKQLFLSAYVNEYKMVGKKANMKPMWETLRANRLDLEPPVSLKANAYLVCALPDVSENVMLGKGGFGGGDGRTACAH